MISILWYLSELGKQKLMTFDFRSDHMADSGMAHRYSGWVITPADQLAIAVEDETDQAGSAAVLMKYFLNPAKEQSGEQDSPLEITSQYDAVRLNPNGSLQPIEVVCLQH